MDGILSARKRRRSAVSAPALCALVAIVAASTLVTGCGDEESAAPAIDEQQPHLSVAEVESVLERGRLAVVRTGGGDTSADREGLVDLVRYESQSGREFEIFVWETPRIAQRQRSSLLAAARAQHGEDAAVLRAANVIAVFPGPRAGSTPTAPRRTRSAAWEPRASAAPAPRSGCSGCASVTTPCRRRARASTATRPRRRRT